VHVSGYRVTIPPTYLFPFKVSLLDQLRDNSDCRSLCYAYRDRHISEPHLRISRQAYEYVAVITEKGPATPGLSGQPLGSICFLSLLPCVVVRAWHDSLIPQWSDFAPCDPAESRFLASSLYITRRLRDPIHEIQDR
jgi:hypothetical protein